ncbi:MAG: HEAT repeat domain-containing protein [Candidatus Heimdallarchaeota archaeon]|nr:HEAT repeat domain-containing protein [Candidatus Heimdallarchaeota archaeon]
MSTKYIDRLDDSESIINLISELKDKDSKEINNLATVISKLGDKVVEPLIDAFKDEDKDVRYLAARFLEEIGSYAVEPLIAELGNFQSTVRVCAVETLGKIGDSKAIHPLINTLKDKKEDALVREYAVYALERIGKPAVKTLITALKELDDPNAIAPLKAALFYNQKDVRQIASEIASDLQDCYFTYKDVKSILKRDHKKVPQSKGITSEYLREKYSRKKGDKYLRFTQTTLTEFYKD